MSNKLKVLINATSLLAPLTGIGHYTNQLRYGLENNPQVSDIRYFSRNAWGNSNISAIVPRRNRDEQSGYAQHIARTLGIIPYLRVFVENTIDFCTQHQRNQYKDYIYHEPGFVAQRFSGKTVVTIHDLSFYRYPQYHPKHRVQYLARGLEQSILRAQHFITVSEYVRNEVINHFNVRPDQVTAIYNGVNRDFSPYNEADVVATLQKYKLLFGHYLLVVGAFEPRKNLLNLFKAYELLPDREKQQFPLVHVGPSGWLNQEMNEIAERLSRKGFLKRLGYVSEKELPFLYAGARGLAYPSIYEGFGLPILEGMASGIPVLAANTSSMPEVLGNVGILVDPYDISQLQQGLEKLLTDTSFRNWAIQAGLERARLFSWEHCVNKTLAVYRKVV